MKTIFVAPWVLASMVAAAGPPPERAPLFGFVRVGGGSPACVVISSGHPEVGDPVSVIELSSSPVVFQARIGAKSTSPCDVGGAQGESFELVQLEGDVPEDAMGSIATDPTRQEVREISDSVWEVVGSEPKRTFRLCASMEGLHYTAWEGGRRIWHEYYYLGYDVEPTCTEEQTVD